VVTVGAQGARPSSSLIAPPLNLVVLDSTRASAPPGVQREGCMFSDVNLELIRAKALSRVDCCRIEFWPRIRARMWQGPQDFERHASLP
jgi:hypothetical protein